jgi:Tol biopolymer transport system component
VTDHFVIEGEGQYLVMDFIEGEDLRHRLERDGQVDEAVCLPWFLEIADALAYLHSRTPPILHRDIKPGNIKITPESKAYLVDFGLAKVVDGSTETTTGAKAMTPGFSPPEQYGSGQTDTRTDIYSLAATLFTALTATIPEDSLERAMGRAKLTPVRKRAPTVSQGLSRVVERALALEPDERYQTVPELAEALIGAVGTSRPKLRVDLPYLRDKTVLRESLTRRVSPPTRVAPVRAKPRRWPRLAVIGLAFAVIGVGAVYALPSMLPPYLTGTDEGSPATQPAATEALVSLENETPGQQAATEGPQVDASQPVTQSAGGPSPTAQGGGIGQLAFASARSGIPQIYVMNVDGTGLVELTQLTDGACQPAWSPDGSQLAFTSPCRANRDQYSGASIWTMNADGSGQLPLATALGGDYDPAWSPDGDRIAFTSLQDGRPQIYLINTDGTGRTNLTDSLAHESNPNWSPSGTQLIYTSTRSGTSEVWVMTTDGSERQRFSRSAGRDNREPTWSPDGQLVLFDQEIGGIRRLVVTQYTEGGAPEIRVCSDGQLSVQPMAEPSFSPDGRWLVFETWPTGVSHNIALMTLNCTSYAALTSDNALDFDAAWRP